MVPTPHTREDEEEDAERTQIRRPNTRMPLTEPADELVHVLVPQPTGIAPPIRLGPGPLVIGRTEGADVVLGGSEVSRRHCQLDLVGVEVIVGGEVLLTDLNSTNGTFVDGTRVAGTVALAPGARIAVGSHHFLYDRRGRRELDEAEALERELQRANQYVLAILPLPLREGPLRAEWYFIPCTRLGGDAFGYREIGGGRFAGYMIDVAGEGAGVAMHSVTIANVLRLDGMLGADFANPAAVLARLDAGFPMAMHDGLTFAIWYWCYDTATRELAWCAAGTHPAVLVAPGAAPSLLGGDNPALGLGTGGFVPGSVTVPPGGRLYLFSDGAFAVEDATGRRHGIDHLLAAIAAPPLAGVTEPQRLYSLIRDAARPGPLEDDFSLVVLAFP